MVKVKYSSHTHVIIKYNIGLSKTGLTINYFVDQFYFPLGFQT